MIETDTARTFQELYRSAQDELVADNVSENIFAVELASLRQPSSGFHKIRAKTLPSVPKKLCYMTTSRTIIA